MKWNEIETKQIKAKRRECKLEFANVPIMIVVTFPLLRVRMHLNSADLRYVRCSKFYMHVFMFECIWCVFVVLHASAVLCAGSFVAFAEFSKWNGTNFRKLQQQIISISPSTWANQPDMAFHAIVCACFFFHRYICWMHKFSLLPFGLLQRHCYKLWNIVVLFLLHSSVQSMIQWYSYKNLHSNSYEHRTVLSNLMRICCSMILYLGEGEKRLYRSIKQWVPSVPNGSVEDM